MSELRCFEKQGCKVCSKDAADCVGVKPVQNTWTHLSYHEAAAFATIVVTAALTVC